MPARLPVRPLGTHWLLLRSSQWSPHCPATPSVDSVELITSTCPSVEHHQRSLALVAMSRGTHVGYLVGTTSMLLTDADWIWQNIKVPDDMHFDTGYPSTPYGK